MSDTVAVTVDAMIEPSPEKIYPFHLIDNIWAIVFVWRQKGRLSELFCAVLYTTDLHNHKHT